MSNLGNKTMVTGTTGLTTIQSTEQKAAMCEFLARLRSAEHELFMAIAVGTTNELFHRQLMELITRLLPGVKPCLISCDNELTQWRVQSQTGWLNLALDDVGRLEKVPQSMITFAASPSRETSRQKDLRNHADWVAWFSVLDDQELSRCDMLSVQDEDRRWLILSLFADEDRAKVENYDVEIELVLQGVKHLAFAQRERLQAERVLTDSQKLDPTTGLLRRHAFDDVFSIMHKDARRYFQRLAMVSVQVNEIAVNDDLKPIAKALADTLRDNDLIGRYIENEFLMAMRINQLDDVEVVAKKLLTALTSESLQGYESVKNGINIGIAMYPEQSNTASLYHSAHNAAKAVAENIGYRIEYYGNYVQNLDEAYGL